MQIHGFLALMIILSIWCVHVSAPPSPPVDATLSPSFTLETRPDHAARLTTPPTGASDQNPAYSPDGSLLVFTRFDNGYNEGPAGLFLLDLITNHVVRLTPWEDQDNVNLPGSAWSGVIDRILFSSDRQEANDIWRIAPDGSDFSYVTSHVGLPWYFEPSWSPDAQWIVFEARAPGSSEDGTVGHIWKIRADGSGLTKLTRDPSYDDRQPNWSPVGDLILFQRRALPDGQWDIYTIQPDGKDMQNVTGNPADDTDASWSSDGMWIICSSDYGGLTVPNIFAYPGQANHLCE